MQRHAVNDGTGEGRMTRALVLAIVGALSSAAAAQTNEATVERLDPALDAPVSANAKVELVKGGFGFTEGPVWVQKGREGYLLFTDIPGNVVWKLTPDGNASVYLSNVGYNGPEVWRWGGIQNNGYDKNDPKFEEFAMIGADGLTLDRQGRLILATFAGRSLMRIEPNRKRTILADSWEGKRFGGPRMSWSNAMARSISPIRLAPSACATRTRARSLRSTASTAGRMASSRSSSRTCRR